MFHECKPWTSHYPCVIIGSFLKCHSYCTLTVLVWELQPIEKKDGVDFNMGTFLVEKRERTPWRFTEVTVRRSRITSQQGHIVTCNNTSVSMKLYVWGWQVICMQPCKDRTRRLSFRGSRGRSQSQLTLGERRGTPRTGRQSITWLTETDNHSSSHSHLQAI